MTPYFYCIFLKGLILGIYHNLFLFMSCKQTSYINGYRTFVFRSINNNRRVINTHMCERTPPLYMLHMYHLSVYAGGKSHILQHIDITKKKKTRSVCHVHLFVIQCPYVYIHRIQTPSTFSQKPHIQ